jgi:hypothetical protein
MAWMEEEQKRMIADTAERGEARRAQNKKIIRIAGAVAILALGVLAVDLFTGEKGARLPMDLGDPEGTVAEWEREGFVKSIDETASTIVVDETIWNDISNDEKTTIVAFLGSYCSERRGAEEPIISIRGHASKALLGSIDSVGMTIK